jgi:hypothetical protein
VTTHPKPLLRAVRRWCAACPALLAGLIGMSAACAQGMSEGQVKAAYVFHFARYVEWPAKSFAAPGAALILCVAGREPFGGALGALEGKQVQGRELRIKRGVTAEELAGCHVLLISDSEERRVATWLGATPAGVLTVSESEGFVDAGGAIGLIGADERIKFDVNADALGRAGLKASAQLLKVARVVTGLRRN